MNTGAYVTLSYGIKYENVLFPGCATPEEGGISRQALGIRLPSATW